MCFSEEGENTCRLLKTDPDGETAASAFVMVIMQNDRRREMDENVLQSRIIIIIVK